LLHQKDLVQDRKEVETQKENQTENMWVNELISEGTDLERQERITGRQRIISPEKAELNFVRRQRNISSEMHKNSSQLGQSRDQYLSDESRVRVMPDEVRGRILSDDVRLRGFPDEGRVSGTRMPHSSLLTKRRRWLGDARDDEIPPRQRRTERMASSRSALLKRYGIQTPTHSRIKPHRFGSRRGLY